MKRETIRHPKTWDLASRLNCRRPEALGYLTLLWDFTAEYSPRGDIGKFPDGSIAGACDWPGDATTFIDAMTKAGWLDRHSAHRLVVHDWSDHCERWVKLKIERLGLNMINFAVEASTEPSTERSTEASAEPSTERSPPRDQSNPIQSNPNRTGPDPGPSRLDGLNSKATERAEVISANPTLAAAALVAIEPKDAGALERDGAFATLGNGHLRPSALREWFRRQQSLDPPICEGTRADLLFVLAAGLYAMKLPEQSVKKSRIAAFIAAVSRQKWKLVKRYLPEAEDQLVRLEANDLKQTKEPS